MYFEEISEIVIRIEPYGKVETFLIGHGLSENYEKQNNDITLHKTINWRGVDIGNFDTEPIRLPSGVLTEKGLLQQIMNFIDANQSNLMNIFRVWDFVEKDTSLRDMQNFCVDKNDAKEAFSKNAKTIKVAIEQCAEFDAISEISLPLSQTAHIKLVELEKSFAKQEETETKKKERRSRKKFDTSDFKSIGERDGFNCAFCGTYEDLEVDHVIPVSKGGSNDLDNLQLLCKTCNTSKGAKPNELAKLEREIKELENLKTTQPDANVISLDKQLADKKRLARIKEIARKMRDKGLL